MTTTLTGLPLDQLNQILSCLNPVNLCTMRLVSHFARQHIDTQPYWKQLVIDRKGKLFTTSLIPEWRNFIYIDEALTNVFLQKVALVKSRHDIQKIQSLSLLCLDLGIVVANTQYYFRLSKEHIELLKTKSCLNFADWITSLENIMSELLSKPIPIQLPFNFKENQIYVRRLEEKWKKPCIGVLAFIKMHQISDIFISHHMVYIHTFKPDFGKIELRDVLFEGKELEREKSRDLFAIWNTATPSKKDIYYKAVQLRLSDPNSGMREYLADEAKIKQSAREFLNRNILKEIKNN